MSYQKQNFVSGATLYASQLNAMDDQIYENAEWLMTRAILLAEEIPDTVQTYTFSGGSVTQVLHSRNGSAVRTDAFTYGSGVITETRTLATGESLTITTNLTTLETTVVYAAAA